MNERRSLSVHGRYLQEPGLVPSLKGELRGDCPIGVPAFQRVLRREALTVTPSQGDEAIVVSLQINLQSNAQVVPAPVSGVENSVFDPGFGLDENVLVFHCAD